jgi:hypothetical protein
MDGYSVKEAATVLGVPKRRVWELIARGVLSGAPEGDGGMRVFLQPRPARSTPLSAEREEPRRTNGNGGHTEAAGEGSPFREILTEFRSLTERYGQALLALGEARGEVAALRSRVELLEARLDLRLPGPRPSSTVAWEMPGYSPPPPREEEPAPAAVPEAASEPAPEQLEADATVAEPSPFDSAEFADELTAESLVEPAPEDAAPVTLPEEPVQETATPRRRRTQRRAAAMAGFAEALARAQDPTLANLPGAREAAEALAALQSEVEARDATLEVPPTPDLEPAGDEDTAAMAVPPDAEVEAVSQVESESEGEGVGASFVEPAAAVAAEDLVAEEPSMAAGPAVLPAEPPAPPQQEAELVTPPTVVVEAEPEPVAAAEPEPEPEAEAEAEPERVAAAEPEPEPEARPAFAAETASSPYTTEVVEPDWFADGDFTWLEAAQAEAEHAEPAPAEATLLEETPAAESSAMAEPIAPPESEGVAEADADQHERADEEGVPGADAIQDAFEGAEVRWEADAEIEPVAEVEPIAEVEPVLEVEASPAADAMQDAFEAVDEQPETAAGVEAAVDVEAASETEAVGEIEDGAEVEAAAEVEATADESEPGVQASRDIAEAEPTSAEPEAMAEAEEYEPSAAAEAIQDAFEPLGPEPETQRTEPEIGDRAPAHAESSESPFIPDDVAVFSVRQPEPETPTAETLAETAPEEGPPEVRGSAAASTEEPSAAPPLMAGLGGVAVEAAIEAAAPPVAEEPPAPPAPPAAAADGEEELMWLGDEFEAAGLEIATPGWRSQPDVSVQPAHEAAHGMSDSDLEQIAQDEGWDADEVEAIRTLLGRATPSTTAPPVEPIQLEQTVALPVDASPAEAPPDDVHPMDAAPIDDSPMDAAPIAAAPEPVASIEPSEAEAPAVSNAELDDARGTDAPAPPAMSVEETIRRSLRARTEQTPGTPEPEWLRRRRGPAANAYRRLRRLLPG